MKEIETKIIKIDVTNIRNKILNLGGTLVKNEKQLNLIYDYEDGSLMNNKGYARVRKIIDFIKSEERYYLTVKKLITTVPYKIMDEHETLVSDLDEAKEILKALGLNLVKEITKTRESYKLYESLIEIDICEKNICPFPYLEIESKDEEELSTIIKLLGYSVDDAHSETLDEILSKEGVLK